MSFFDSKEEVIKIELTSHGKYLLSKGKLNPKFYAFYDDDILYDSRYANFSESQNDSQERILKETAYCKPIPNIETSQRKSFDPSVNNFPLPYEIGTSDHNSEYIPSWHIQPITNEIQSVTIDPSNCDDYNKSCNFLTIPEITLKNSHIQFTTNQTPSIFLVSDNNNIKSVYMHQHNVVNSLRVEEKNTPDEKEKFLLEVFIKDNPGSEWRKLVFYKDKEEIEDDILLDTPRYSLKPFNYTDDTVEYYLDIIFDDKAKALVEIKKMNPNYNMPSGTPIEDC